MSCFFQKYCKVFELCSAANGFEWNGIFIAFISESIEKFSALEILSEALQFTCCWLSGSVRYPSPPLHTWRPVEWGLAGVETANNSSSRQRISHAARIRFIFQFLFLAIFGMQLKVWHSMKFAQFAQLLAAAC